jgi:hypothetical protein
MSFPRTAIVFLSLGHVYSKRKVGGVGVLARLTYTSVIVTNVAIGKYKGSE